MDQYLQKISKVPACVYYMNTIFWSWSQFRGKWLKLKWIDERPYNLKIYNCRKS